MDKREKFKKVIDNFALHFNEISNKFELSASMDYKDCIILDNLANRDNEKDPALWKCNLNIGKIKQDLNNEDFYLSFLYEISKEEQEHFLAILAHTELAKIYYETYCEKWRDYKEKKMDKGKENIFEKVIEVVKMDKNLDDKQTENDDTIKYLNYLSKTLQAKHYTERQFYEDFLFRTYKMLKEIDNNRFSKGKIINIVNKIIKKYFCSSHDDDRCIDFSNKINIENLDNFISRTYTYETARGIDLIHTFPKRK